MKPMCFQINDLRNYLRFQVIMGKSRAEIQREYRARQKEKLGDEYFARETARVKRYYVPCEDLRPRDKEKRRERTRTAVRKYRQKKREKRSGRDEA